MEANIIGPDGEIDVPDWLDKRLDVVLMGFHRAARNANWAKWFQFIIANGKAMTESGKRRQQDRNTRAFVRAIENHRVDAITHPQYIARLHMEEVGPGLCQNRHSCGDQQQTRGYHLGGIAVLPFLRARIFSSAVTPITPALWAWWIGRWPGPEAAGIPPERVFNSTTYQGGKRLPCQ